MLPPAQCAGFSGTLVPLQDSLSLTHKLISSTRLDCLTLVLPSYHVRAHFYSKFLLIFKTYTTVQNYLEMCSSMKEEVFLKSQHPSCFVTFALLLAVKIIETQCWYLSFLLMCWMDFYVFFYTFHRFSLLLSVVKQQKILWILGGIFAMNPLEN